jgi:hypothetical protein
VCVCWFDFLGVINYKQAFLTQFSEALLIAPGEQQHLCIRPALVRMVRERLQAVGFRNDCPGAPSGYI